MTLTKTNSNEVYPPCMYCHYGKLIHVTDLIVDEDDENLPDTMQDKEWLFSGNVCDY